MNHRLELTGKKFGKLTVIRNTGEKTRGCFLWECLCECGSPSFVRATSLATGQTLSCGCTRRIRGIETRQKVESLWRDKGLEPIEIAKRLGLTTERVYQCLRPLGRTNQSAKEARRQRVRNAETKGKTLIKVAAELGLCVDTVRRCLTSEQRQGMKIGHKVRSENCNAKAKRREGFRFPGSSVVIVKVLDDTRAGRGRLCIVRCDCGTERQVLLGNVVSGMTKSCGCRYGGKIRRRHVG